MSQILRRKLNDELDPTDADRCMQIAHRTLALLVVCERVLNAERAGMRVGRDDAIDLAVRMREAGKAMGLVDMGDTLSVTAFHQALER